MRYRLRTLMIVLAILPPVLALGWHATTNRLAFAALLLGELVLLVALGLFRDSKPVSE